MLEAMVTTPVHYSWTGGVYRYTETVCVYGGLWMM